MVNQNGGGMDIEAVGNVCFFVNVLFNIFLLKLFNTHRHSFFFQLPALLPVPPIENGGRRAGRGRPVGRRVPPPPDVPVRHTLFTYIIRPHCQ
jgi:hypothetical protein